MSMQLIPATCSRVLLTCVVIMGAMVWVAFATSAFAVQAVQGQAIGGEPGSSSALEFPVTLRNSVESGRTPVGTKIQAKLTVATLVERVVVPEGAKLYGEVTESVVASGSESGSGSRSVSSRLGIRIDSAEWKVGSKPVTISFKSKVYLTAWYYPLVSQLDRTSADGEPTILRNPQQRRSGPSGYPSTTPHSTPPFPTSTTDSDPDPVPPRPKSNTLQHRELMKDVEPVHNFDGSVTLTSTQSKITLDKSTTYVFSSAALLPTK
jgi:hypothetical protein